MTSINPIFEPFIEAHRYKVATPKAVEVATAAIGEAALRSAARRQPVRIPALVTAKQHAIFGNPVALPPSSVKGIRLSLEIQRSMIPSSRNEC